MYGFNLLGRNYYIFNRKKETEEDIKYYMVKCSENTKPQRIYPLHNPFHCEDMEDTKIIVTVFAINTCGTISAKPKAVPLPIMHSKKKEFYRRLFHFL